MSENAEINPNSFMTEAEQNRIDYSKMDLEEEVIQLNRVAKVVKGGRRFSFSALVVVGDRKGHVGLGFGKANEVPESIQKGVQNAKKNLIRVPRVRNTIPYAINGKYRAACVMLKPGETTTAEELSAFMYDHLARYKVPKSVEILDELPLSSMGKILKRELRQRFVD